LWHGRNRFFTPFFVLLFFVFLLAPHRIQAAKNKQPIISRISIRSTDIFDFDTKPYLKKFPYSWINFLHIKSVERIIKQELLLKEGDELDDFLIRETERNLRALPFIRAARIGRFPQPDGTLVLVVYVSDSWTTEPQINLSGINNLDDVEFGFKEKNLLGYGKSFDFFYNENSDSNFIRRTYRYTDRRLLRSRWEFKGEYSDSTDGEERKASLNRPFYSADTRWAFGTSYSRAESIVEEVASNNVKRSEFDQTKEVSQVRAGAKVGGGRKIITRLGGRYRKENKAFARNDKTAANRTLPKSEEFQTLIADVEVIRNKFVELTQVEKMTRVEDFNLGPVLALSPGYSPDLLTGQNDSTQFDAFFEKNFLFKNQHFWRNTINHSSRNTFENRTNEKYKIDSTFYRRQSRWHTFVFHSRAEWGHELDLDNKIFLGGDSGLRAFERKSIVGDKGFVFNFEDRAYLVPELWDLFSIGGVAFFDTGYVWDQKDPLDFSELRSNVGVGLRIGLIHSSNEVIIRADVSYKLNKLNSDDDEFVFSFGSGQAF